MDEREEKDGLRTIQFHMAGEGLGVCVDAGDQGVKGKR